MTTTVMGKFVLDISPYWKEGATVNAVYNEIKGTEYELGRHTLTRAKEGRLEKANIESIVKLTRLCSMWSGKQLRFEHLMVEENES